MKRFCLIMIGCFLWITSSSVAFSSDKKAQLIFPEISVTSEQEFKCPIILDQVPNLAGIKLALTYDKNVLTYVKSEKTKITASLMHIVNDKHPGKLVIVMAGARGVPVMNQSVMDLYFKVNKTIPKAFDTQFKVIDIQLMSDSLKELAYETHLSPVHIQALQLSESKDTVSEIKKTKQTVSKTSVSEKQDITQNVSKTSTANGKSVTPQKAQNAQKQ
ncbi:MAG: hypothetical protein HQK75_06850 [Candidatus Magnetomorum sp.]|nr:hypothetical protein [Candidatus Magnetomorum sp.]